ncbi:hypothetical protein GCM10010517_70040 [Streptosporangium fragile]|uniref:Uncharacterized protein n=1 Tax=Streptosporangium fragile TaxID=46186 RepID=A0ABP6IQB4_9ACTN
MNPVRDVPYALGAIPAGGGAVPAAMDSAAERRPANPGEWSFLSASRGTDRPRPRGRAAVPAQAEPRGADWSLHRRRDGRGRPEGQVPPPRPGANRPAGETHKAR